MRRGRPDLSGQPVLPSVSLSSVRPVQYIPSFAVALTNNSAEVIVLFLVWCVAHRLSEVETEVVEAGMRVTYGLRVRHPCPFLATCDFKVYVLKAPVYHSVVLIVLLIF